MPLKSVATFAVAVAAGNYSFITNANSPAIIKRDLNGITFENDMKNSSLVNSSGGYNFSTADGGNPPCPQDLATKSWSNLTFLDNVPKTKNPANSEFAGL